MALNDTEKKLAKLRQEQQNELARKQAMMEAAQQEQNEDDPQEEEQQPSSDLVRNIENGGKTAQKVGDTAKKVQKTAETAKKAGQLMSAISKSGFLVEVLPWILGGLAIIAIIVLIASCIPCLGGNCGRTPTTATDVVKNRPNILTVLYYSGDKKARITLIIEHAEELKTIFEQIQKDNAGNKDINEKSQQLINLFNDLITSKASQSREELVGKAEKIDVLFSEFKNVYDFGTKNLEDYIKFANSKGSNLQNPLSYGMFNSPRTANASTGRRSDGLHNGYDFPAPAGTPVIAGWDGTVGPNPPYNYEASSWALEVNSGTFIVIYGHINITNPELRTVGTKVTKGEQIGTVYDNHLDIKIKSEDGRWIDWGGSTWKVRTGSSYDANNNTATVEWKTN